MEDEQKDHLACLLYTASHLMSYIMASSTKAEAEEIASTMREMFSGNINRHNATILACSIMVGLMLDVGKIDSDAMIEDIKREREEANGQNPDDM